ncbi:Fe-S oxidoreductase [Halalkaliarchaeum desulfuricum]|uniref:Fe-S oxidoreductase n=1 Tax=Halalkaliarchaeum desulfuricum TaxID=2055893 RepID=A0A343TK60_9EURY|nr:(Fe-S)-binding protein [Halalkaliarchaeum desulfuricum]AUX09482.1 Fe-S oxidoreductase [Halalkaliarchaeum desulfuricum]
MSKADEAAPLYVDDDRWDRVVEATDGAASVCYQCGTCTASCPYDAIDEKPISVRGLMRQSQLGVDGVGEELYRCLTCKECEASCPRGVDIMDAIGGLREVAFEEDEAPGRLEGALWSVYEEDNPWERPASDRDAWLEEVPDDIDVPVGGQADILYYVGCTPSYDPSLQSVPAAMVQLLEAADVDYTVLGDEEVCCGDVVRQTGEPDFFQQLSEMNAALFEETDAETIITTSPHCAETFEDGADLGAEVVHYTEYLAELLEGGQLEFGDLDRTVTFHDPCYLARGMAAVEAPRQLLAAAGVEVDELAESGADTLCCGGGGGNMWREGDGGKRFADIRAKQADDTDAEELLTACPYCVQTLDDGVKKVGAEAPVRELATVLLEALEAGDETDANNGGD